MIPKINNTTQVLAKITPKPKTLLSATAGSLAVLSTHQVWPHPERPSGMPRIDVQPDVPKTEFDNDIDPSEITPFGDLVASDNVIDVFGHVVDKAKDALDNIKNFFENIGH